LEGSRNYSEIAIQQHVTRATVYNWIERFNTLGLPGLIDQPRSGRPPIYSSDERAEVVAAALTKPEELGLEFGSWTLDRLEEYLNSGLGIAIKRSRIDEILLEEGLRWRKQETWFGEKVDPEFAKKGDH
jgi:transposase